MRRLVSVRVFYILGGRYINCIRERGGNVLLLLSDLFISCSNCVC